MERSSKEAKDLCNQMAMRLKAARIKSGRSQADVASSLGVTPQTVSYLEKGEIKLSALDAKLFSDLYDVPVAYLIDGAEGLQPDQAREKEPEHIALALPEGTSYDDISEEGKAELYKFIQYLKHTYPKKKE